MTIRDIWKRLCVTGFAGFVSATALNAQPAATDPWAKVPALPTTCYLKEDPAYAKLETAHESVSADHVAQNAINEQITKSIKNIDPMELARRMQEKMMEDPQNAAKYMEAMQSTGTRLQTEVPQALEAEGQMETESKDVITRYKAALDQAYGPANARWKALTKKLGIPEDSPGIGELGVEDWAWEEFGAVKKEWDRAYVATCAQWWGAGGQVHLFMQRYKDWLVQERIPRDEEYEEHEMSSYAMLTPTTSHRSVAAMEAVEDYIRLAQGLFGERRWEPRCAAGEC